MVMDYSEGSPNFAVVNQPNITFPGITLHPTVVALTATTGFILSYTSFNYLLIARYTINGSSVMLTEVQSNESKFNPYAQTYGTYATALQAPLAAGATPNANSLALYNMFSAYPSPSNANAYSDFSICYDQGAVN
jgi:hypothetical protein